jgi:hypothetical protein
VDSQKRNVGKQQAVSREVTAIIENYVPSSASVKLNKNYCFTAGVVDVARFRFIFI